MTTLKRRQAEELTERLRVAAELAEIGLPLPKKPRTDVPDLAGVDLTDLEDGALMDQLVKLTRWADYSGGQLALADVDEAFAKQYVEQLTAQNLVETWEAGADDKKKPGVTVARAAKASDPVYVEAKQEQLNAYARRKLLSARHEAFERDAAVVSRELTRRLERSPSERRTARYGGAS